MVGNNVKADIVISHHETQMYNHISREAPPSNRFNDATSYTIKIKKRRHRTAFTTDQLLVLENTFTANKYIDIKRRKELADRLMINEKSIKTWFQNRRMKNKRLSNSSCDSSSDGIGSLSVNSDRSSNDCQVQVPSRQTLQTLETDDMNYYPQYNQHQFIGYADCQYNPSYYNHHNYQYYNGHVYDNNECNQVGPQQYNLCHL